MSLEDLWSRIEARMQRLEDEAAEERRAALPLAAELARLPPGERLETVEREPRFWTLGLVEQLLDAAAAAPGSPLDLAELALALAARLDPARYGESLVVEQGVVAWSLWAEAQRRRGDSAEAEVGFRAALRRLEGEPLDGPGRALFCRNLARLRRDQRRDDEALALFQRAADLFEQWKKPAATGEALSERGWLCLDAGDPASAQPALEQASLLLRDARPETAVRTWHGLALCYAELALRPEAERALASARSLYDRIPGATDHLRLGVMEARIASRLGRGEEAVARLAGALPALLAAEAYYDAAVAALDLVEIYVAGSRVAELERLAEQCAPLFEPGALPQRARSVFLFALRMARRPGRGMTAVLAEAGEFLARAREHPEMRFRPGREFRIEQPWDRLDPGLRRLMCEEAGVPVAVATQPARDVSPTVRDLVSWTCEETAGVRIDFEPAAAEPEECGGPWRILARGRAWAGEEVEARAALLPERLEVVQGRLLWSEEERRALLAMLLENVGADEAVRLGNPETWREAVASLAARP